MFWSPPSGVSMPQKLSRVIVLPVGISFFQAVIVQDLLNTRRKTQENMYLADGCEDMHL